AFKTVYARTEFTSSLALVSPSGQVVGSLADDIKFVEDSDVAQEEQPNALAAKAPVVIDYDEKASQIEGREVRRVHCAEDLGDSIVSSSEIISEYIVKGANLVSDGMLAGTQKLTAYISPNEKPLTFLPQTRERVLRAKRLTGAALKVTSKVVETAVNMAMMVGSTVLGPPSKPGTPGKASEKSSAKTLGLKLGCAIGNVAGGVDRGARILWNATSISTASLVGHRYGVEARDLAVDALSVAENLTLVYFDSKGVARRVIVRRAAAKLVKERLEKTRQQSAKFAVS
ncbi:MAG: senescence-associated protein-domain-containing protein, partial [Olpidium bornovanus]